MAKPKSNSDEPVSLFPFLSILACLIGVLTFIITGVAISQMDQSEDLAAVERTEKYGPLVAQLNADKEELQTLDANYAAELAIKEEIDKLKAQVAEAKQLAEQQQAREKVMQQAQAIRQQLTQVKTKIDSIKPQISEIREEIKQDQTELEKRIEAGKPAGTVVRPAGSGINLKPHFIECTKDQLVLHTGGKQIKIAYGKIAKSRNSLDYSIASLRRIKSASSSYCVRTAFEPITSLRGSRVNGSVVMARFPCRRMGLWTYRCLIRPFS